MIDLHDCRKEIDRIDNEIIRLFEERMKVVEQVADFRGVLHGVFLLSIRKRRGFPRPGGPGFGPVPQGCSSGGGWALQGDYLKRR